ncbi:hypothetical protein [Mangrovimonas xylaniphaga]|uniref:hypothetical protein n=1 Tax=Mangrovimonas xylaniphaga TaxID=1645915 RepID=UPI0006B5A115|nr:hypothetical protein [Mangrovimonas xylaniphaga]
MQILKTALLGCTVFLAVSCGGDSETQTVIVNETKVDPNQITSKDIEALDFTDYMLNSSSQTKVADWEKLHELNTQADFLKKGDLSFFAGSDSIVKVFVGEFKAGIPESVKTNVIQARVTALETKLLKLNGATELDNVSKKELLQDIKEFLEALANLNLQINKKFEKDANNVGRPE